MSVITVVCPDSGLKADVLFGLVGVALAHGMGEALKHNSTQNDLPEEFFFDERDF